MSKTYGQYGRRLIIGYEKLLAPGNIFKLIEEADETI